MSLLTYGLFGLTAISSLGGFVFNLLTGNPDMALMCFVGVGGSAAIGWGGVLPVGGGGKEVRGAWSFAGEGSPAAEPNEL